MANLLLNVWLLGVCVPAVLYSKVYGAKTVSAKESTNITDLTITRHFPSCSSLDSTCVLKCSAHSVPEPTLTWYKENQIRSQIKVFDRNPNPSLPLYVEYQDKNNYRCVLNSTIKNQTIHLDITQYCEPCPDITQTAVSAKEGDPVTLHANLKDIKKETLILWRFGPYGILICEISDNSVHLYDCSDGRFRDRLQLDIQTGDLTITNTSKLHSGIYKLQVNNESSSCWSHNVTVSEPLPSPQISNHSNHCPSSDSECVLECSVENVTKGNLSWYKGNSLLSTISLSDLNYLCLDLNYKDNGNYSCVVSNSFISETKYLIISELCSVQSNNLILIILGLIIIIIFAVVIILILGLYFYKRKQARQEEAESQTATSQNSPPATSSNGTDRNAKKEHRPLIDRSSSTNTS